MDDGGTPNFWVYAKLVKYKTTATIQLHDAIPSHTLREVFVRRTNDYLLNACVAFGRDSSGSKRIVSLELHHRPYDDTSR